MFLPSQKTILSAHLSRAFKPKRRESQGNICFTVDCRRGPEDHNSFELGDKEKQKIGVIFQLQVDNIAEPKSNFRIARYQLHGFRQSDNESVDL